MDVELVPYHFGTLYIKGKNNMNDYIGVGGHLACFHFIHFRGPMDFVVREAKRGYLATNAKGPWERNASSCCHHRRCHCRCFFVFVFFFILFFCGFLVPNVVGVKKKRGED